MHQEDNPAGQIPFQTYVNLSLEILACREEIVERIQSLLNAQKKPLLFQQDQDLLSSSLKDCFFQPDNTSQDQSRLTDLLETAHWASGFKPRMSPGNDLINPAAMMIRAFHLWRQTNWPGRNGRVRYAQTLFNLFLLRYLLLLSMRLWDPGSDGAGERLSQIQHLLNRLWHGSPVDQPVLIRDARWLIPVAQSPTTDQLDGYFVTAEKLSDSFTEEDLTETQRAAVVLGGGHLRAQLRHMAVQQGRALDDHSLMLSTRRSNALDLALLVQGLVPLLKAYDQSCIHSVIQKRQLLAAAIFQGISPDPELFLNCPALLGPYSMIEHLFIKTGSAAQTGYTPIGIRHQNLVVEYHVLIQRLAKNLYSDYQDCRPVENEYSPYGVLYGFSSNLVELMAFKTLQREAVPNLSVEDVFSKGKSDRIDWVNGWRRFPHIKPEVSKMFEYPRQFVDEISSRIEKSLLRCISGSVVNLPEKMGCLYILAEAVHGDDTRLANIPELPFHYTVTSDPDILAASKAVAMDNQDLLACRLEGEFVLSYQSAGGWVGISKDLLTDVIGSGSSAWISALPISASRVLAKMCPELVVVLES